MLPIHLDLPRGRRQRFAACAGLAELGHLDTRARPVLLAVLTPWRIAFAEDTVEERIAATVVARMAAMDGMAGDDTRRIEEIASILELAGA